MLLPTLLSLAAFVGPTVSQLYKGSNYGSTFTDNSPKAESDFFQEFQKAQSLGFSSARLFTTVQAATANSPIAAIPAALDTSTSLLLGLWGSGGQAAFDNELAALKSAISQYGQQFADAVVGISVGSEDLYRISPTGIENQAGIGAGPSDITNYISQLRSTISGTILSGKPVGHVDTWTAWVNGSNSAVTSAVDFVGTDAYPYFQNTQVNSIDNGMELFFDALNATIDSAQGKPVWVTETGWPISGPTSNQAVPSVENAQRYYSEVACSLYGAYNTWWYVLQDAAPTTPSPSFGIIGSSLSDSPAYDISCGTSPGSSSSSSAPPSSSTPPSSSPPASSPPPSSPTTSPGSAPPVGPSTTSSTPSPSGSSCPTILGAGFEYPHLIIPVNSASPSTAYGTSYNGHFSPTISSLFNFDIPSTDAGKTCTLVFLFPTQDQLRTSSFTLSGAGGMTISALTSPATTSTTYDTVPGSSGAVGTVSSVTPGNSYVISSGACAAGQTVGYEISATATLDLEYFQDDDQAPIGLYITVC